MRHDNRLMSRLHLRSLNGPRGARLLYSLFLSFPRYERYQHRSRFHHVIVLFLVENNGFEPLTLCVQSRCSSQLS